MTEPELNFGLLNVNLNVGIRFREVKTPFAMAHGSG